MTKKIQTKKRTSIKRLLIIFCTITALIVGLIIAKTAGPKTWDAIAEIKPSYLFLSLLLGTIMISINAAIVEVLTTSASGKKIGFLYSIETVLSYYFLSSISPTLTGGEPIMIYMLTRRGVPFGKALMVTLVRGLLVLLLIAIAAPIMIYFRGEFIESASLRKFFYAIAMCISVIGIFAIYAFYTPKKTKKLIHKLTLKITKWRIFSKRIKNLEEKVDRWVEDFASSLKYFFRYQKKIISIVVTLTLLSIAANYLIAFALISGLGLHVSLADVIMMQFVLYFFLYFTPTPGGSGVAEGGAYFMFSPYVPEHVLEIFIMLWRFFTTYLWTFAGGIFIAKWIGFDIIDNIPSTLDEVEKAAKSKKHKPTASVNGRR